MAIECVENWPGLEASGDLSADQFRFMTVDASGQAERAGAGVSALGVLQDKPAAAGRAASVSKPGSTTKVVAGAAVAAGADVTSDASGRAVTSSSGNYIAGKARTAAANAGELITLYQVPLGRTA